MSNQSYITKSLSDQSCCQYVLTSPRLYKIIVCKLYNLYYIYTCNSWGKLIYSNEAIYSTLVIRSWPVLMSVHILAMCVERQLLTIVNLYYMFYLFRHFQFMGKIGYSNGQFIVHCLSNHLLKLMPWDVCWKKVTLRCQFILHVLSAKLLAMCVERKLLWGANLYNM